MYGDFRRVSYFDFLFLFEVEDISSIIYSRSTTLFLQSP